MKHVKILGLLAVVVAALMAFAGNASATLTSPAGTLYGGEFDAASSGATSLTGGLTITCQKSTLNGKATTNDANLASGPITNLTFEECGNHTVSVTNRGNFEILDGGLGAGAFYSNGLEITLLLHSPLLGTLHCILHTDVTEIGTINGGTGAALTVNSGGIHRIVTDTGCPTELFWEGSYVVKTPHELIID